MNKNGKYASLKNVIIGLLSLVTLLSSRQAKTFDLPPRDRTVIAGKDRIQTSIEVSQIGFGEHNMAILVNAEEFADSVSAIPLAAKYDCPILLTYSGQLRQDTVTELQRLGVEEVYLIGGTKSLSKDIDMQLNDLGVQHHRLSGANRYETNSIVNEFVFGDKNYDHVVYVNGGAFPDTVVAGPVLYQLSAPVVLTDLNGDRLYFKQTEQAQSIVIGGGFTDKFFKRIGGGDLHLFGDNRYLTAAEVNKYFFADEEDTVYITTGETFADALTATTITKGRNGIHLANKASEVRSPLPKTIIGGRVQDDVSASQNVAIYVAPHPDDEILASGFQLMEDILLGRTVYVLYVTDGEASGVLATINERRIECGMTPLTPTEFGRQRVAEAQSLADIYGRSRDDFISLGYTQNNINTDDLIDDLSNFIDDLPQQNIYLRSLSRHPNDPSAGNADHAIVNTAVRVVRTGKNCSLKEFSLVDKGGTDPMGDVFYPTEFSYNMWEAGIRAYSQVGSDTPTIVGISYLSGRPLFENYQEIGINYYRTVLSE